MKYIQIILLIELFCISKIFGSQQSKEKIQKNNLPEIKQSSTLQTAPNKTNYINKPTNNSNKLNQNQKKPQKQSNSQSNDSQLKQLIETFVNDAHKIPSNKEKPKTQKEAKDQNKKYSKALNSTYESYKKMYEYITKNNAITITQSQYDEVKNGAKILFNSKNIKHMSWTKEKIKVENANNKTMNKK
jgi:hypothetical protein